MKYLIKDAKCGITEGGIACGPVPGAVIAEAEFEDENGNVFWICLDEFDGVPCFYRSEKSLFDFRMMDLDDYENLPDDITDYIDDCVIHFSGYDYEDIFTESDPESVELYRYLIWLVRCPQGDDQKFIRETVGKHIGDFEIPMSDVEMDFRDIEYEY